MIQMNQLSNPESLKFVSEKIVSDAGTEEFQNNIKINNELKELLNLKV